MSGWERESEGKSKQVVSDPVVALCVGEDVTRLGESCVCFFLVLLFFFISGKVENKKPKHSKRGELELICYRTYKIGLLGS